MGLRRRFSLSEDHILHSNIHLLTLKETGEQSFLVRLAHLFEVRRWGRGAGRQGLAWLCAPWHPCTLAPMHPSRYMGGAVCPAPAPALTLLTLDPDSAEFPTRPFTSLLSAGWGASLPGAPHHREP